MGLIPTPVQNTLRARADKHVGLLAEYSNPGELVEAVEAVRREGYSKIDTFTPFPIHGMDHSMGLSPSKLGYIVIGGGLGAAMTAALARLPQGSPWFVRPVSAARLGDDAGVVGAGLAAFDGARP